MELKKGIEKFNLFCKQGTPFLFVIDYEQTKVFIEILDKLDNNNILFNINGKNNEIDTKTKHPLQNYSFVRSPISKVAYSKSFNLVKNHLIQGNSYLSNLTCETPIESNLNLRDIFHYSKAPYRLFYKDEFVCFSPETFVKIIDGKIYSYPMKGTIDASIPNATESILNNKKEAAEHATIVDLIRNDLSQIATNINVDKYRYIDSIKTNQGELLQVSSQISGDLPTTYREHLGDSFFKLLPAGSISGAPKPKTIQIIEDAETYKRKFYTGIMGLFDGENIDSGVMIRFIEKQNNKLNFKSGGGITVNSVMDEEYKEMISKVYLPF